MSNHYLVFFFMWPWLHCIVLSSSKKLLPSFCVARGQLEYQFFPYYMNVHAHTITFRLMYSAVITTLSRILVTCLHASS